MVYKNDARTHIMNKILKIINKPTVAQEYNSIVLVLKSPLHYVV